MKRHSPKAKNTKAIIQYESGPVKIKDGLFMGDQEAARDMDFLISNKVTHIINTVVKKIPNLYEKYGIYYLSVHWTEKEKNIFDKKNQALTQIYNFIEQAEEQGQCVLVHSMNGKSRAATVVISYLMKKYCWSLSKAKEFVENKKQKLKIRENFQVELQNLETRLKNEKSLSSDWNDMHNDEDLVLANTHKNTKINAEQSQPKKLTKKRVKWPQKNVAEHSRNTEKAVHTSYSRYVKLTDSTKKLRSILKGQKDEEQVKYESPKQDISFERLQQSEERLARSQMIGQIRGNVVNVTVNNYITEDSHIKQNSSLKNTSRYNSIQEKDRSSSRRDLQKRIESKSGSRLMPYENIISSFRSPYDSNFMSKVGTNPKNKRNEESQLRHYNTSIPVHDRPQSVGGKEVRKPKTYAQLLAASAAKKKPQINSNRQRIFKYK